MGGELSKYSISRNDKSSVGFEFMALVRKTKRKTFST